MSATPDSVIQDGSAQSQSTITVSTIDPSGQSVARDVQLTLQGPGRLSATAVHTPGSVVYIPPSSVSGTPSVVTILGNIIDTTGASSASGPLAAPQISLTIRPATAVASTAPFARALASSNAPATQQPVVFDGTASCGTQLIAGACPGTSALTGFTWDFGDGTIASGPVVSHTFKAAGAFVVTLTVTNDKGVQGLASGTVNVTTAVAPTAAFVVSPGTVHVNNDVNFNAAASKAAPGHSIQQFIWNFGNGTSQTTTSQSLTVPTAFASANTFKVTLTVVDDLGQTATTEVDVTVVP
jgi:hypothetical protein